MAGRKIQHIIPSAVVAMLVGYAAFYVAGLHKVLDPLVVGIVLGMVVRLFIGQHDFFDEGLNLVARMIIPIGIIIYGVNIKFHKLDIIPFATWLQIIIGVIIIFGLNQLLCKRLSVASETGLLISVGTAICGASAIAFATPAVKAKSEDTGTSLLVITIWGLVGVICYPWLQEWLNMSSDNYALLCATTLHQTGLVKTAAAQQGSDCLQVAMTIKMARTCMIIVIICLLPWLTGPKKSAERGPKCRSLWFLGGFVLVGLAFSFLPGLRPYATKVKPFASLIWTMAMTSLGLTVDLRSVARKMARPLLLGLVLWLAVVINFFVGYYGMGY
ncbi:MAG: putative sulfate exporter family transporter [Actinobacteria bacterium]|nr:putative sulfate exporter family transporter [Actinomycetota bacterium]